MTVRVTLELSPQDIQPGRPFHIPPQGEEETRWFWVWMQVTVFLLNARYRYLRNGV